MNKLIATTAFAVLAIAVAGPAFARNEPYVHHESTSSSYETVTYNKRLVRTPLTADQIVERQRMQTQIEYDMKKADLNSDRLISFSEYLNGDQRFYRYTPNSASSAEQAFNDSDVNQDGKLTSQEIMDYWWASRQPVLVTPSDVVETHTTKRVIYSKR